MSQPFRFVHASDFHLERPLRATADTPDHLAPLLLDSRYRAAEHVFDLALTSRADFLILAGDIVHVDRAGPRALHFLHTQFTRLAEQGVAIYWAGGQSERASPWPDDLPLPPNVHYFARGAAQQRIHYDDGTALAQLLGTSEVARDGALALGAFARPKLSASTEGSRRGRGALFTIGVAHGRLKNERAAGKIAVDYWALGGRHGRERLKKVRRAEKATANGASPSQPQAVYSGAPQGGSASEQGPHGAIFVQVDEQGRPHTQFTPTDQLRWRRIHMALDGALSYAEVEHRLEAKVEAELARAPGHDLFLEWQIGVEGEAHPAWASESGRADLLAWLRRSFGSRAPLAWSMGVEFVWPARGGKKRPAHVAADGTLLADFLIAVETFAVEEADVPWRQMLPETLRDSHLAVALTAPLEPAARRKMLEEVASLGRELLGGEEVGQ